MAKLSAHGHELGRIIRRSPDEPRVEADGDCPRLRFVDNTTEFSFRSDGHILLHQKARWADTGRLTTWGWKLWKKVKPAQVKAGMRDQAMARMIRRFLDGTWDEGISYAVKGELGRELTAQLQVERDEYPERIRRSRQQRVIDGNERAPQCGHSACEEQYVETGDATCHAPKCMQAVDA